MSLSEAGLCLLGYQWSWSLTCHPNRSKPYCRLLPCKNSLPFYLCFANAKSKQLASTLASALLPNFLLVGPYLLANWSITMQADTDAQTIGVSLHCTACGLD